MWYMDIAASVPSPISLTYEVPFSDLQASCGTCARWLGSLTSDMQRTSATVWPLVLSTIRVRHTCSSFVRLLHAGPCSCSVCCLKCSRPSNSARLSPPWRGEVAWPCISQAAACNYGRGNVRRRRRPSSTYLHVGGPFGEKKALSWQCSSAGVSIYSLSVAKTGVNSILSLRKVLRGLETGETEDGQAPT